MTTKELVAQLNGRSYPFSLTKAESDVARDSGIVVVYGSSDDLMEFEGAIRDEIGCYDGGIVYLTCNGLVGNDCDNEECPYFLSAREKATTIRAVWHDSAEPSWTYETDIPHEMFEVIDVDGVYCRGIVFALSDVEAGRD